MAAPQQQTKLVKPKTKAGKRALERKAPKTVRLIDCTGRPAGDAPHSSLPTSYTEQVEDPKRALFILGGRTNQNIKDILTDLKKLKGTEAVKYTKKNPDVAPFEYGGEASLEKYAHNTNCSLFAIGSHTKKRPSNLILGRMYDFRLYDMIEFGVLAYKSIAQCPGAMHAQLGNKPCFAFVGDGFENEPRLKQSKSLLLDFFRGRQVDALNLMGLDRVILITHTSANTILFRQYSIALKKSGTKIPRVSMTESGPSLDLEIRRTKEPPGDLEKEAMKQPKLTRKKEKNVGTDLLEGRVGRIYVPKQDVDTIALNKMKGLKRERREAAEEKKEKKAKSS